MPRTVKLALPSVFAIVASLALATGAGAKAKLTADYRFEGNLKSTGGDAHALTAIGGCLFTEFIVNGSPDGVCRWFSGDGLRLRRAAKVLGAKGKTYTFVMLLSLEEVTGYRKLVDFDKRQGDEGWYVYDHSLYPYDLEKFEHDEQLVQPNTYLQIALTRNEDGLVRGYVGDEKIGEAKDKRKDIALGPDKVLHFLIDDNETNTEQTGGSIARLRIWDDALSAKKIKRLG
jgi:hypothetical protein